MALVYSATGSLDGYVADPVGDFQFAAPVEELHLFVNQVFGAAGTLLLGRRTYDLMDYWDTVDLSGDVDRAEAVRPLWREREKIVYSRTLAEVTHPRTQLRRSFDADAVRELKATTDRNIMIGGSRPPHEAFRAGLVDEVWTFLVPEVIGGGTPMFAAETRTTLDLIEQRRFGSGAVGLHYRVLS